MSEAVLEPETVQTLDESQPMILGSDIVDELRAHALDSLYFFARGVLGFDWLTPEIHGPICDILENPANTRVKITLPRGWLKSTLCTIAYPLWRACKDPNIRCLVVQNTFTNACSKLRIIDQVIKGNERFRLLFPELLPTSAQIWKADAMCLPRSKALVECTFEAAGIGTQITGRHYDLVVEDDTVSPDLNEVSIDNIVPTKNDIDQAIGYHKLLTSIIVDINTSQILVVGTRWFQVDLLSWIDANEGQWYKSYSRAARETNGVPDWNGAYVWPKRFGEEALSKIMSALGTYMFSCLYMNQPVASDDMVFKLEWFKEYDTVPANLLYYQVVDPGGDPARAKGKKGDFTVVMTLAKSVITGFVYLMHYERKRMSAGETIEAIFTQYRMFKPLAVQIETTAYQDSLVYWLQEQMRAKEIYFRVATFNSRKNKELRIRGLQPLFEAGKFFIKSHMKDFVQEAIAFPLGAYDDLIDAAAQGLNLLNATTGAEKRDDRKDRRPTYGDIIEEMVKDSENQQGYESLLEIPRSFADAA